MGAHLPLSGTGNKGLIDPRAISGLTAWYKAELTKNHSDGTVPCVNDNDIIRSWTDASGNGNLLAVTADANAPRYYNAIVNGLPIARFNGNNAFIQNAAVSGLGQPCTVFAVTIIRATLAGSNHIILADASAAPYLYQGSTGKVTLGAGSTLQESSDRAASVWQITMGILNGGSSAIYVNGVSVAAGAAGATGFAGIALGGQTASSELGGDIAEVLFYSGAIADTDRRNLENYFAARYAIALG